jgi:Winged helix-turn helix
MREGIDIEVSAADRERLAAVVGDRNSRQKHVWRARIILATGEGCGTAEIMRRAGVSKPCVWRWQERFMHEGVAGLLHGAKTRSATIAVSAGRPCRRADPGGAAGRGDALDRPGDGGNKRHLAALGAAHLGGARFAAAPGAAVQTVAGPGVCRQIARCGRALS